MASTSKDSRVLAERLDALRALRTSWETQGTICQSEIRSSLESLDLKLPDNLAIASYTQAPSSTNYLETLEWVRLEALRQQSECESITKSELKAELDKFLCLFRRNSNHLRMVDHDLPRLRFAEVHVHGVSTIAEIVRLVRGELALKELKALELTLEQWRSSETTYQAVLRNPAERGLHPLNDLPGFLPIFQDWLEVKFKVTPKEVEDVAKRLTAWKQALLVAQDDHCEPWSPDVLVNKVALCTEWPELDTALKLSTSAYESKVQNLRDDLEQLDSLEDARTRLLAVRLVSDFLQLCWQLVVVHEDAVVQARSIATSIQHIRSLAA